MSPTVRHNQHCRRTRRNWTLANQRLKIGTPIGRKPRCVDESKRRRGNRQTVKLKIQHWGKWGERWQRGASMKKMVERKMSSKNSARSERSGKMTTTRAGSAGAKKEVCRKSQADFVVFAVFVIIPFFYCLWTLLASVVVFIVFVYIFFTSFLLLFLCAFFYLPFIFFNRISNGCITSWA